MGWLARLFGHGTDDSEWIDWHPASSTPMPGFSIFTNAPVKYSRHTHDAALQFITSARRTGTPGALDLEREPANPHDQNAIRVIASIDGNRVQIGYVPAEVAAQIASEFPADMPLQARLARASTHKDAFAVFIDILRPAKRSNWWKENMRT